MLATPKLLHLVNYSKYSISIQDQREAKISGSLMVSGPGFHILSEWMMVNHIVIEKCSFKYGKNITSRDYDIYNIHILGAAFAIISPLSTIQATLHICPLLNFSYIFLVSGNTEPLYSMTLSMKTLFFID